MGTGIFGIGVSGLAAAQLGLLTTEHNVVNANTPGYTRQRTVQATNIAVNTGAGAIGQGVHVQTIERMYDRFLTAQVNTAQTKVSELDSYYSEISQIDNLLADANAGLSPTLQEFFAGAQAVAANPSSLAARQSMISSAETLAERFHTLDTRLTELSNEVNGRISDGVLEVNNYASMIAELNQKIVIAESSYSQPSNDLRDQRDQLVNELNKLIKVSTTTNSDGSYNVFIGSGQQLVVGPTVQKLTAQPSSADPSRIVIGMATTSGSIEMPERLVVGGELGGLVKFRSTSLDKATNEIGRIATSLALTFNAQHELGQDLLGKIKGESGFVGDLFSITTKQPLAYAGNSGSGSLALSFDDPVAPSGPDYSGNFLTNLTPSSYQVAFGPASTYTITRLSDNQVVTPSFDGPTLLFDGLRLDIATAGADGDKFLLQPYAEVARNIGVDARISADPRLIAAGAPARVTQDQNNTGALKISQGVMGSDYDVSSMPVQLNVSATNLSSSSASWPTTDWSAIYSDGSPATTGTGGNIPLVNGSGATLSKLSFSGMVFDVSGTPPSGANVDNYSVERNAAGFQDGRNAILFAKLQTQNTTAGGTASYQSSYARMVAANGVSTREAKVQMEAQQTVLQQAQASREALSGVNLDEEAANILRYQQAYQASSKILEVGSKLFDTILSLG